MTIAGAADATTTLGGSAKENELTHTSQNNCHHLGRIFMPLIEWTCIAGIPTLLCIKIIGLPTTIILWSNRGSVESDHFLLQWMLLILVITSILSLIAILFFGDTPCHDNGHAKSRGMGITMGSHLIPLLYLALQLLFVPSGDKIESDHTSACTSEDIMQAEYASCSSGKKDYGTSTVSIGLNHLAFASLGGFAFATAYMWSQYNNHRKCNFKRWNNNLADFNQANGDTNNGNRNIQGGDDAYSGCSTSATMSICWKIYLMLVIIFQCTMHEVSSSGYYIRTLLFGMIHLLLILAYSQKNEKTIRGTWQDAFTPGEWMTVSTLITSLVGECIIEYSGATSCNYSKAETLPIFYSLLPLHLIVAHAGLVGCLAGVALSSFLTKHLPNYVLYQRTGDARNAMRTNLGMVVSFVTVAGTTFGCLGIALNYRLGDSDGQSAIEHTCTDFNLPIILCDHIIPRSVQWLIRFLSSNIVIALDGSTISFLRSTILGYWCFILAIGLPVASMLELWIAFALGGQRYIGNGNITYGAIVRAKKKKKKRVIIARKFFHLVAILLFTPITWLDEDMMALSYAIAIALLIVLEMVRGWIHSEPGVTSSWNRFYMIFLDDKDSPATKGGLVISHISLIVGCAFPLWMKQLLQQNYIMLSATDTLSSKSVPGTLLFHSDEIISSLLPVLGLLVLGIGDSAGAICGLKFGRHHWPGDSSRTLEGSLCMFLSMMLSVFLCTVLMASANNDAKYQDIKDIVNYAIDHMFRASLPLGMITLIEASTTQIDNLSLPIAGSTLVILMTAIGR
mmetsp:Transcript_22280/g.40141  ORF Transcript_22280/g.40141 Transcript_22280/m.40141 type:complete len:792 (+) Transcript_22280:558-2933(+)|eukprot:CAMPEP_0196135246 /NCGR_PEP_ID=MMETSP0910-20130528/3951_1 /TAXON_ID=49265 /ORGANISM="Thalassiosira rotula, Strain GSO102" /LENGTH=791 /DNA_ID=CAMNT_0041395359 /DNA_START=166 /DNA_END=2541 /DNA_ORIENTATION=+